MSNVNFSQYDPRIVKKFLYHLLEVNASPSRPSMPNKETRHVGEVFKVGMQKSTSRVEDAHNEEVEALQQKIAGLEDKLHSMEAKFEQLINSMSKQVDKVAQTEQVILKRQKKDEVKEANDVAKVKRELEALEDLYSKLEISGEHSPEDLARVKDKIDTLKNKLG